VEVANRRIADDGTAQSKSLVSNTTKDNALQDEDVDEPAFLSLPSQENQEGWYPTLRVTLWVLSCLWSYVDVSQTRHSFFLLLCHVFLAPGFIVQF
jgi:hypothetical protein